MEKSRDTEVPVGAQLKKRRQSLKLSLAQVELATKVRGKYLAWIEQSDFSQLPNDIYTRGFIAKYADYLGLDVEAVTSKYAQERGGRIDRALVGSPRPVKGKRFIVTPRIMIAGSFLVVLAFVVAYLSWQFSALAAAPRLRVDSPPGDLVVEASTLTVAGEVAGGADIFINDSPILTDSNGAFSNKLALQDGVNTITVMAKNKLGKSTRLTRNILAHLPKITDQPLVPNAPFDGIAVGVTVKDTATNITASIDDLPPTTLTMLPGAVRNFQGKTKVIIQTSNSAVTGIIITNSLTANKDLGIIGKGGQLKRQFAKDTVFP